MMKFYNNCMIVLVVILLSGTLWGMDSSNQPSKPIDIASTTVGWKRKSLNKDPMHNGNDSSHSLMYYEWPGSSSPVTNLPIPNTTSSNGNVEQLRGGCCP